MIVEAFSLPIDTKSTHLTKQKVQQLKRKREADQKRKAIHKIEKIDRRKYTVQQAMERDEKKKEPVEVVEVGEDIGVTAKSKSTPASQFAREYSSQMQQSGFNVNPEFE